ncbi:MAG: 16S rRNA (guanine(527)-N(7))-methyltransferase RsmG [Nitriliruptoraceae bacterium]
MDTVELSPPLQQLAALILASPHNLVSRSARHELESRHIPESIRLAMQLPRSERSLRLLDVGSGGGLPGLVIALERPDLEVELLDAKQKKVEFLRQAASALGLTVTVHHGRAEELVRTDLGASFDLVTARAVAPLDRLVPWTVPFLRPGGLLFAVKGERWEQELLEAQQALEAGGATVVETPRTAQSSSGEGPRVILIARSVPRENTR